jgi:hypothetical protein
LITPAAAGQPAAANQSLEQFIAALQQAVARNDQRAVAGMASYPLEVMAGKLQIPVADANAFVSLYDSLMSPATKAAIARARAGGAGQKNAGGAVTLDGGVTIEPVGSGFKITKLTMPSSAQSGSPGAPTSRLLTFRVGTPTEVSGSLNPGGRDQYDFRATQGALLDARLSGVPGRSVLLRIVDSKTGTPVDARADAGSRVWTGRLSAASQYRIEVVRQPDSGTETLIYTLAVALK